MYQSIYVVSKEADHSESPEEEAEKIAIDLAVNTGDVDYVKDPSRVKTLPDGITESNVRVYGDTFVLNDPEIPEEEIVIWELAAHVKPGDALFIA
jgi:hypothetical protein